MYYNLIQTKKTKCIGRLEFEKRIFYFQQKLLRLCGKADLKIYVLTLFRLLITFCPKK